MNRPKYGIPAELIAMVKGEAFESALLIPSSNRGSVYGTSSPTKVKENM